MKKAAHTSQTSDMPFVEPMLAKPVLEQIASRFEEPLRFSVSFSATADKMINVVTHQGLEGIVAKRKDSLYQPGLRNGA